ncbi:hypothetical protein V8C40DRAFT_223823 [Trichoderma camerunense]|uniref:Uncharacterized protein n=1 Tax=Trichoderma harzianum CBS 226.95 TaxID=983964 RepID=A0A2T4A3Z8_TRIHA|nr:hypothetical protein M431DRAFT_225395 [Trichoderma harzianum CBS 226.95]PKK53574.1 hypothetical protein CI102_2054 [Trichoderma harzianum]PTB51693.1 hypothetical protein M431DRAFT_225395 [Trichoderma harzianum CBS 226.95]
MRTGTRLQVMGGLYATRESRARASPRRASYSYKDMALLVRLTTCKSFPVVSIIYCICPTAPKVSIA